MYKKRLFIWGWDFPTMLNVHGSAKFRWINCCFVRIRGEKWKLLPKWKWKQSKTKLDEDTKRDGTNRKGFLFVCPVPCMQKQGQKCQFIAHSNGMRAPEQRCEMAKKLLLCKRQYGVRQMLFISCVPPPMIMGVLRILQPPSGHSPIVRILYDYLHISSW